MLSPNPRHLHKASGPKLQALRPKQNLAEHGDFSGEIGAVASSNKLLES